MPGFDPQQAALPAQAYNEQMLANYAKSMARMVQDQNALLADQLRRFYKKPSVFKGLNTFSSIRNYPAPDPSSPFCQGLLTYVVTALPQIFVFNIEDATEVDVSMTIFNGVAPPSPQFLFAAMTPLSASVNINLSDFFQIPLVMANGETSSAGGDGVATNSATVQCDGNRFLHLAGIAQGQIDILSQLTNLSAPDTIGGVLTIALKK